MGEGGGRTAGTHGKKSRNDHSVSRLERAVVAPPKRLLELLFEVGKRGAEAVVEEAGVSGARRGRERWSARRR